jgi:NAD(P)-dependent dehydrogenase (short-subunit alcohol dehydrogenase family)
MFDLTDRVAVVVGGTSGIGRSIAIGLAEAGAHVVPISRRRELVEEVVREVEQLGRRSLVLPADANDPVAVDEFTSEVILQFGRLDILVNSQGITKKIPSVEMSEKTWDEIMDVNLKSVFRTCQRVGRELIRQRKGKIINICSLGSFLSLHEATAYCVSKAGVAMLTRSLGCEWAPFNVNVNAIAPGVFRTPLNSSLLDIPERRERILNRTPMGRLGRLDELVGVALFLASDASSFVTGEIISVDGGFLAHGI